MNLTKIIVLDDDPTGSQTVHGCLLLTRWDPATLREALRDASPLFFILTNTRGMSPQQAAETTRQVCCNIRNTLDALEQVGIVVHPIFVSRSDSTLRGHYPVETDVIAQELGPFDAHFLVPAFFEGGRVTRNGTHYLKVNEQWVPVHETEFARDSVFSYSYSFLPDYVAEKTGGRIPANKVRQFALENIHGNMLPTLMKLEGNQCCVVDAEQPGDLDHFARQIRAAAERGKRFLFRSAASLLTAFAQLPPQPVSAEHMARYVRGNQPGAVIVGSHVAKTTRQLQALLRCQGVVGIEIDVLRIAAERDSFLQTVTREAERIHRDGKTPVIYTSRVEQTFGDTQARLDFGVQVSEFLMDVVRNLPATIGFLISKGGITSNDVLSSGLALRTSRVLGQILPGCSVVRCPAHHPRFPDLPVVIFPGNVGDDNALATVYTRLRPRPTETDNGGGDGTRLAVH